MLLLVLPKGYVRLVEIKESTEGDLLLTLVLTNNVYLERIYILDLYIIDTLVARIMV